MRIKAYSIIESIMILIIISICSQIFTIQKINMNDKKEIISGITHSQFQSFINYEKTEYNHPKVSKKVWFNMSGNVNQANTITIEGSKQSFTIMLHTGRIRD